MSVKLKVLEIMILLSMYTLSIYINLFVNYLQNLSKLLKF